MKVSDDGAFRVYVYAPPTLWQNHHMKSFPAREALRIVDGHRKDFLATWGRLHG